MFIRPCYRSKNGKRHSYWALVESYRTERGPRQRVVAYLSNLDESERLGVQQAAEGTSHDAAAQQMLFPSPETAPRFVEIDTAAVRVENAREFGGPWLAWQLIRRLGLDEFLRKTIATGDEAVPWSVMALVLVIARLCRPSSELYIAEHFYRGSALSDLLGVADEKINESRVYRALDQLLPHKEALEVFFKQRLGELFDLDYDLLLYDITSTYFEGQAAANPLAQRGYSRDQRPDCKQVCIALVVSRCGMPLGYEVFAGNTADVTTVQHIVTRMESRYGRSNRVWVMDRGMVSEENVQFLKEGGRRYILGTPKPLLKKFERQLLEAGWHTAQVGVEVKLCADPDGGEETFILCRSRDRREKDEAILRRFEERVETRLKAIATRCQKQHRDPLTVSDYLASRYIVDGLARGRSPVGPEHARCAAVRRPRRVRRRRPCAAEMAKDHRAPRLGHAQRRLLPAPQQRPRLERRGAVAGLYPTHRSRIGLPHRKKRSEPATNLAPEGTPRASPHPGLLPGLRAVENAGPTLPEIRLGPRTAPCPGRTVEPTNH